MSRLSAIDESVPLSRLLDRDNLEEIAKSFADLHGASVTIAERGGEVLARAGPEPTGEEGEVRHTERLSYGGEPVARITVGPFAEGGDAERARTLAGHIREVLGVLVHTAYARHLTATVHVAAMEEAFAELRDKNKRLEAAIDRLKEVDRLKSSFLATISHELRTPLTSVIGYAEMIMEGLAGEVNREQKEFLQTILSKADQLLQLITGLLDVSLVESRSLKIKREAVSLVEVLDSVVSHLRPDAERRGVHLEVPEVTLPRALVDRRKIRQVFLHLVANAIKFSPAGGSVGIQLEVGALAPEDRSTFGSPFWTGQLSRRFGLRASVTDAGIGIPKEEQPKIFEPFFQVDSSSTREYGGTGLGLSLAKSYVEAHGGYIWVESEPDTGSTFTVTLPAVPEELESFAADRTASKPGQ